MTSFEKKHRLPGFYLPGLVRNVIVFFALLPFPGRLVAQNDWVNGVTTYDLVLISKHILGLEPLNSPYKIIAADAANPIGVTTFDIVELRKLVLGIYTALPNRPSWRFVPENYVFSDPTNPFLTPPNPPFPEFIEVTTPVENADFVAVKVGDVNNSVISGCSGSCNAWGSKPVGNYTLSIPENHAKSGEIWTVPVSLAEDFPVAAVQMSIGFDPDELELIGPSLGDIPGFIADNFGLTGVEEGRIRVSWFAMPGEEEPARPGQTLFNLTFRVKKRLTSVQNALKLNEEKEIPNLAWKTDGTAYNLRLAVTPPAQSRDESRDYSRDNALQARCRPNPTSGEMRIDFTAPTDGKVRLSVYDAFGKRVMFEENQFKSGPQTLHLSGVSSLPDGVYHWELKSGKLRSEGRFIKQ